MKVSIRYGLCCQFLDAPIRFRAATHRYVWGLEPAARREYLAGIAQDNAAALLASVGECRRLGIGAFRINSGILPLSTHPASGYRLPGIDPDGTTEALFREAGEAARAADLRLSFHPDQFVVLNSEREAVVASSVSELEYQAAVAELVRVRAALENDDRQYAPADLLPLCRRLGIPLVYDVHHHRCRPDGLSVEEATLAAAETWNGREPYSHISSPRDGWDAANPRPHADYVDLADWPDAWRGVRMTVDVEAKDKERAVTALMREIGSGPVVKPRGRKSGRKAGQTSGG